MIKIISKDYSEITVSDLKKHLNIEIDYIEDDNLLSNLIKASVGYCEAVKGQSLTPTVKEYWSYNISNQIYIDERDVDVINEIKVDGVVVTGYTLNKFYTYSTIIFDETINGDVVVNYSTPPNQADYGENIKIAILIKASDLYDNERSNYTYQLNNNKTVELLLNYTN